MLVAWLIFWWCGAFMSFPLAFLRYKQWYKIVFYSILSWIGVAREIYLINKELKEEENKFKDYGKIKQERD